MKAYKVVFSCPSAITELPDSQTLFGAICTIINDTKGSEEFERYIHSFEIGKPLFVHSSMFQNDMFPMIKKNIFSADTVNDMVQKTTSIEKLHMLESLKTYKKIKYMSEEIYEKYVKTNHLDELRSDLLNHPDFFLTDNNSLVLKEEKTQKENKSVLLTRNGFPEAGTDKTLFYVNALYYPEDTEFCVYIKANENKEYLTSIFKYIDYFGIGTRRTAGLNGFKFKRIDEIQLGDHAEYCLVMSKLIPSENEFDFNDSYYQLSSDIFRTSKNYAGGFINGKYTHLLEGSWMKPFNKKDYYGRIIKTRTCDKAVYHYGIGFVV